MKPSPELLDAPLIAGVAGLAKQIAQHSPEVRHGLALAWFTALDTADRDALVGHGACVLHQLRESPATQMRRPPQMHRCGDRRVDIIGAEDQRAAPYGRFDLRPVARRTFALPSTHVRNDTGGGSISPLPQTPTRRPTGARLF